MHVWAWIERDEGGPSLEAILDRLAAYFRRRRWTGERGRDPLSLTALKQPRSGWPDARFEVRDGRLAVMFYLPLRERDVKLVRALRGVLSRMGGARLVREEL